MTPSFSLTASVLGTPDPQGLARFHQSMLGWAIHDDGHPFCLFARKPVP